MDQNLASPLVDPSYVTRLLSLQRVTTDALADAESLDEALPKMLASICDILQWQVGAFWLAHETKQTIECIAIWSEPARAEGNFAAATRATRLQFGEGLPGSVWESRQARWVTDLNGEKNFARHDAAWDEGLRSAFAFPARGAGGGVVGVMEFYSCSANQPDPFLLQLMDSIGGQIGQVAGRVRAIQFLSESEARKSAILETALDCIVSMNHSGMITEWNPAAERTFGYTKDEAIHREMAEVIIPPKLREAHRRGLAHYLRTNEGPVLGKRIEVTAMRKDGGEFPVELAITRLKTAGPPVFTAYLRDITARAELERSLVERVAEANRLIAQLRATEHQLQTAVRTRDDFLSIASHELKTPVTALQLQLELNKRKIDAGQSDVFSPERVTKFVEHSLKQVQRLVTLIEDLLDVSRIEVGKLDYEFQNFDLTAVAGEVVARVQNVPATSKITFDGPTAVRVHGDPKRIEQVIVNLVSNAMKYGSGNPIHVAVHPRAKDAELTVSDSGIGVKPELLEKIFERYERAVSSSNISGLGLGLYIVKIIVDAHHGKISVASELGVGSTFTLHLPLGD